MRPLRPREWNLTEAQGTERERARDREPRAYLRERAAALLKIADGQSLRAVARGGLYRRRKPETR